MAIYNLPTNAPNMGDEITEAAKSFMSSPVYARQFVDNVDEAVDTRRGTPGDRYGGGVGGLSDAALLAGVLTAEGGSAADQRYILDVINNRVSSGSYPNTVRGVLMDRGQFSALNGVTGYAGGEGGNDLWRAPTDVSSSLADDFISGNFAPGRTQGALNYYNPSLASPAWGGDQFRRMPGSAHVFGTAG